QGHALASARTGPAFRHVGRLIPAEDRRRPVEIADFEETALQLLQFCFGRRAALRARTGVRLRVCRGVRTRLCLHGFFHSLPAISNKANPFTRPRGSVDPSPVSPSAPCPQAERQTI